MGEIALNDEIIIGPTGTQMVAVGFGNSSVHPIGSIGDYYPIRMYEQLSFIVPCDGYMSKLYCAVIGNASSFDVEDIDTQDTEPLLAQIFRCGKNDTAFVPTNLQCSQDFKVGQWQRFEFHSPKNQKAKVYEGDRIYLLLKGGAENDEHPDISDDYIAVRCVNACVLYTF